MSSVPLQQKSEDANEHNIHIGNTKIHEIAKDIHLASPKPVPNPQAALRSFFKGFGVGYGGFTLLNLVLNRRQIFKGKVIAELIFNPAAIRAGLSLGGFGGGYKLIYYLLSRWKGLETSFEGKAEQLEALKSLIGGGIAGLCLLFQRQENRKTIALYLFTRLLQCLYNDSKQRGLWSSPIARVIQRDGDSLLFILACAQVIYAYVMHPDTLPPSYLKFVSKSGPIDDRTLDAVRTICRGGKQPVNLESIMQFCTEKSKGRITVNPLTTAFPTIVPCTAIHPQNTSCLQQIIDTTISSGAKAVPLYSILTFVPLLLFNTASLLRSPFYSLLKAAMGTLRSASFLAVLVGLLQVWTCGHRNLLSKDHKVAYYLGGIFCSTAIFVEKRSRRAELALFVFPRALASLYAQLHKRALVPMIPHGELLLFCLTMSGIMFFHQHSPKTIAPTLSKAVSWLLQ